MTRAEALERYRSLPLPTTSEEAWRFTDLAGFDPDAFVQNGHVSGSDPRNVEVSAGLIDVPSAAVAVVTEAGIEIESAPEGITFEPLTEHPRLGELVDDSEKFAAHNAAEWKHGLLVHVPKGVVLEEPLTCGSSAPPTAAPFSGACWSSPSRRAVSA